MDFRFSEEEQLLQDMVGQFVEREYSFEKRRAILESEDGWSRAIWSQLAELGLLGIDIAEADGGVDAGPVATMLVMNAVGAGLMLEPVLASAIVAPAVLRALDDAAPGRELLPAIAAGKTVVVLAHQEADARHAPSAVRTEARRRNGGYVLAGSKDVVAQATAADTLIVSARSVDDDALALFRVPAQSAGLLLHAYRSLDGAPAADIELDGVELPADALLASGRDAENALERAYDSALMAVCAEAVGAMNVVINITGEYLRTRRQFGRPIGRFQALQHRAADMLIHFEQARSISYLATLHCRSEDRRERQRALSAGKVLVGRACRFVGQQAIQLHGGMGMTDELNVSHYFKRLTAIEIAYGDSETHLDRFIAAG
jgi:hypothetical protein